MEQAILKPGDVIGKYQVVRCLGVGGMGEVQLVMHQQLHSYRALKLLRPDLVSRDPVFGERFLREARIASRIQHKNIIQVMDVENDTASGFFYIVMEYVNGNSLQDVLRAGKLSEGQAVHIISEVVNGLAAASELGLVHRDIKPANIMISQEGEVKLADLGIAKAADDDVSMTLTMDNTVVGTPAYSSPEQCSDAHDVDVRADIYSLGATLYEMVTSIPPFAGANTFDTIAHVLADEPVRPRRLNPEISEGLETLILRMMAKNREERPQTIAELQELLKPFRAANADLPPELKSLIHERVEREVRARTSTVITAYRKKQKGERIISLSLLIALLAAGCIFFIYRSGRSQLEIRRWKAEAAKLENEKKELSAQVTSMKNQMERNRQNYLETIGKLENKIQTQNTELAQLRNMQSARPADSPAETEPSPEKTEPAPAKVTPEKTAAENSDRPAEPESDLPPRVPRSAAAVKRFNYPELTREQCVEKTRSIYQKIPILREVQANSKLLNLRNGIVQACRELDAEKLHRLFSELNITFEELSFYTVADFNLISWILGYNLRSNSWDTERIFAFLSDCARYGYRFPLGRLSEKNSERKVVRNYLDIVKFLLIHPECYFSDRERRGFSKDRRDVTRKRDIYRLLDSVAHYPDFPGWLRQQAEEGLLDKTDESLAPLADRIFLMFHFLPKLTDEQLRFLEFMEKSGFAFQSLNDGDRALVRAIRAGDLNAAEQAIRKGGADPRKKYPIEGNALRLAFSDGVKYNPEIVKMLLKYNVPVRLNQYEYSPNTPLAIAIRRGDQSIADLLVRGGANLRDTAALEAACRQDNYGMAELLVKNGTEPSSNPSAINGVRIYSPDCLFYALERKSVRIALLLLQKYNFNLKRTNRAGKTLLEIADSDPSLKEVADLIRRKTGSPARPESDGTESPKSGDPAPAKTEPAPAQPAGRTAAADPSGGGRHLSNQEFREKQSAVSRKLTNMGIRLHSARNRADREAIVKALNQLDAATLQRLLTKYDISLADLSYEDGNMSRWIYRSSSGAYGPISLEQRRLFLMGLVPSSVIQFRSDSSGWDTHKIHEYLSFCVQNGYRFERTALIKPILGLSLTSRLRNRKEQRNYLALVEFLLIHPESILLDRILQATVDNPRTTVENIVLRTVVFDDFPVWIEQLAIQKKLNAIDKTSSNLLDRIFLRSYALPNLTGEHLRCLETLTGAGFLYQVLTREDQDLIRAIRAGDLQAMEKAIESGADPLKPYPALVNALWFASSDGVKYNPAIIRKLLEMKVPVRPEKKTDSCKTPLAGAIDHSNRGIALLLISRGADLDDSSALEAACRRNDTDMADRLLKGGTRPGRGYSQATSPDGAMSKEKRYTSELLFTALENRAGQVAMMLLQKYEFQYSLRNEDGKTLLEVADSDPALKQAADLIRRKIGKSARP